MNRPDSPRQYIFLIVSVFFFSLTIFQLKEYIEFRKENITSLTKSWSKGIRKIYSTSKKTMTINDFDSKQISVEIFNNPPVILKFRPDSSIETSRITIFPKENSIIMKTNTFEEVVLEKISSYRISMIDRSGSETEDIASACGFRFFIVFLNAEKEIPVEFSVFSDYLYSKQLYPSFFDFIDEKEFF